MQDEEGQHWREGPEEGGIAKAHAARILAELAGDAALHPLLLRSGAAAALSASAVETVCINNNIIFIIIIVCLLGALGLAAAGHSLVGGWICLTGKPTPCGQAV